MRTVCSVGSWNLKPGLLRLSLWTPDFNPSLQKMTFGHFAKVSVEINLKEKLSGQILVEREGFAFFVNIEYGNLQEFCIGFKTIGHLVMNYRKSVKKRISEEFPKAKKVTQGGKTKPFKENDLVIYLEFENRDNLNLEAMERIELTPVNPHSKYPSMEDLNATEVAISPIALIPIIDPKNVEISTELVNLVHFPNLRENVIIQESEHIENHLVANDLGIVGRLWADKDEDGEYD
ncbi:hypothetical protein Lal_00012173 [Lupinus albus]|nr:hypothetical protein Lal_00012173 [Lupinus albus]